MNPAQASIGKTLLKRSRGWLLGILCYHCLIFLLILGMMFLLKIESWAWPDPEFPILIYSGLFSLIGSLTFFSRKCYVYLITSKFLAIAEKTGGDLNDSKTGDEVRSIFLGYYMYLIIRPTFGVIIGPLIYMLVISGLLTFGAGTLPPDGGHLSMVGRYFVYTVSFLGGHTSSDMFDAFSKLGKRLLVSRLKGKLDPSEE